MSVPKLDFMWQYVEHWAKVDPGFIALRSDDRRITSGEFDSLSDSLARSFLRMGLKKGGTIVTMLPSSTEFILTLIAADKVGAIVTAMDMKYKAADLRRFISHIKPAIIVAHPRSGDTDIAASLASVCDELKMRGRVTFVMVGGGPGENFDALTREGPGFEDELRRAKASCGLDDGLLIVFTGGTTGVPKAALLTKQNVAAMASIEAEYLSNIVPGRIKSLASLPPSHVGGTVEMMGAPIAGGHELLIHDSWSPQRVLKTTQEEKLSWIGGVPTMFAIMLLTPDLGAYDLSSLKLAIMSGEKVDMDLLGLIRDRICPTIVIGYGSTEGGSEVTFTEAGDSLEKLADGYVGKALPGVEMKIVDDSEKPLPPGETGEVLVRGPLTIKSYFNMPKEDEEGFTKDGFCRTGDLGYMTPDGGLYIKGRKKHIIRVGGYTVMPSEVEEVIAQVPGVGMSAVIGVPDKVLGEVVWAVVQAIPGIKVTGEQIIEKCGENLAKFKVPKKVLFREELPLTRIGKVHRVEIQNEIIASLKST